MAHAWRDIPAAGSALYIMIGYAYVEIPGVSDLNWDGFQRGVRNPNHLKALTKPKKPGQPDLGQIKCKVLYDPNDATHQAIRDSLLLPAAEKSAALDEFKFEYADGFTTPGHALITGFVSTFSHASGDVETGTWTADMTIEVTEAEFVDGAPAE